MALLVTFWKYSSCSIIAFKSVTAGRVLSATGTISIAQSLLNAYRAPLIMTEPSAFPRAAFPCEQPTRPPGSSPGSRCKPCRSSGRPDRHSPRFYSCSCRCRSAARHSSRSAQPDQIFFLQRRFRRFIRQLRQVASVEGNQQRSVIAQFLHAGFYIRPAHQD